MEEVEGIGRPPWQRWIQSRLLEEMMEGSRMPWWVSGARPIWKQMKWVESNERYISRGKWSLTTDVLPVLEDSGDGD
jgi:hypothetical protein